MLTRHLSTAAALCLLAAITTPRLCAKDTVLADFEGTDFGAWKTTGEAFGKGPEHSALPNQMAVTGFEGHGFASSYHGGDDATGKLTSPAFRIDARYLNFLIGGGGFTGETCVNLISDGKVVRTATGKNVSPGGSEALDWETWDLKDLAGRNATIEVVDKRGGGWGHISIDQVMLSDEPKTLEARREFTVDDKRYLLWPVTLDKSKMHRFTFELDGKPFFFSDICLTDKPDFWTFTDLGDLKGHKLTVTAHLPASLADAWDKVQPAASYPGEEQLYQEPLRPQYHFSSRRGWLNDPNGLVWYQGYWHMFYQHNPYNHGWDNMHWGHAVSTDLLHWQERPDAIYPDATGAMYSGSAVIAPKISAGFPMKGSEALTLIYTAEGSHSNVPGTPSTQGLASSDDGGVTFHKFSGNPILPQITPGNRDPKVFWHEPTRHWIMPLYLDGNDYAIVTSPDLVKWTKASQYRIPGNGECPDLYELPVQGEKESRWVAWGANGRYLLGSFDGRNYKPDGDPQRHYFGAPYAGQTYSNVPGGRRIHIGWMHDDGPVMAGAPFNLQMTLPMEFTLRRVDGKLRLWAEPAAEVASLREDAKAVKEPQDWKNLTYDPSSSPDPLATFAGQQYEADAVIDANSTASSFGFQIAGQYPAVWTKANSAFTGMEGPQPAIDGKLRVHIFVDTVSLEVFVNGTFFGRYIRQQEGAPALKIVAEGGAVHFESLSVHHLQSVWKKP